MFIPMYETQPSEALAISLIFAWKILTDILSSYYPIILLLQENIIPCMDLLSR